MTEPTKQDTFAKLGEGRVAYVKAIRSDDIARLFPDAPPLPKGLDLFALIGADGTPILLAEDADTIIQSAWQNELTTVSLH
ncbi:MAG: DUF1150 domain-containing protein [Alphaproteobacteria bacterium]